MTKITLDAEAFKVLASDTRLQILKSLDERPKTVSELGRELNLNKATVHEHLQQLLNGELIKKNEREGRKWVYYALSWKGKSLLHPENATFMLLLGLAALGSAGAMVQLGNWLRWWGIGQLTGGEDADPSAGADDEFRSFGAEDADAPEADSGDPESSRMAAPAKSQDNMTVGEDGAADDDAGHWYDFLGDGDFWVFAVFLLVATAAVVGAMLVKYHAQGRGLSAPPAEPAEVSLKQTPPGDDE